MPNKHFNDLVAAGNPTGEVVSINEFMVEVRGLSPVAIKSLVMFENGGKGIVWEISDELVSILLLDTAPITVESGVVLQNQKLLTKVGGEFLGRVISVTGEPLDGKGPIPPQATWPVFNDAPPLISRKELDTQVPTGVTVADILFPLSRGQRMAVIGESKSGKSTFLSQIALAQQNTDQIMVFALIAKRRSDIDDLLRRLNEGGVMDRCVVFVSTVFDSLVTSYLIPYVACAMAEYFWQHQARDTIIAYDDLTSHAQVYREISLLAGSSPGRDSYPGDMFYAHSSLLERAGRLESNGKTLTSLPVVLAASGDLTAYLPTNIMSITDGQYIFDLEIFRQGIRPAINHGLSVSRVGGRGQTKLQKDIATKVFKRLASYSEASEYSHFGSELAIEARADLEMGKMLLEVMKQGPADNFSLIAQQLMLSIVLDLNPGSTIDIAKMKTIVEKYASKASDEASVKTVVGQLLNEVAIELKGAEGAEESKNSAEQAQPATVEGGAG